MRKSLISLAVASVMVAPSMSVSAADSIAEAFTNGTTNVSFRLRYEDVNDDSAKDDAEALTLKSRITFATDTYNGFGVLLEVDDVTELDDVDYNDGLNGMTTKTAIVDPEDTGVNQAYISYTGGDTVVKLGRQRILLDNQRFVGGVGFRQNEQTYEAFTVTNNSLADTTLFYGYINEVEDIKGIDADHSTHLLNLKYTGLPIGAISAYYYSIEPDAASDSLDTIGIRLAGSQPAGDTKILYAAEYAAQEDDSTSADPEYYLLEAGAVISGITAKLGYEVLTSDEGVGFSTPLATKHKFQGWTDMFLATPSDGIEDLYVSVGTKVAGVKLLAVYHDYESETGSRDLGDEWGFLVAKKFDKNYSASLKYSDYDASSASGNADKSKLWLTLGANF